VNTAANDRTNAPNKDRPFVAFFKVSNLPGARYTCKLSRGAKFA
jgi:hypothetical protein